MTVIDNAIYVDGHRVLSPATPGETVPALKERGGFAWIGLFRPTPDELAMLAADFGLHQLAIEDTLSGHQRAKLERYGDTRFLVLRPARYLDDVEKVEFGEVHLFVGDDFVIAVRYAESPNLGLVRARLEEDVELLQRGPLGVCYAILDRIVDDYAPVLLGLENDVDEIEEQLFSGDPRVARRIYELSGEVMEFQRATKPLTDMIQTLRAELEGQLDSSDIIELRRSFRDVLDHVIRIVEKAEEIRMTLQNALSVHATLVAQRQNDEMQRLTETSLAQTEQAKKISAWAAIIFAPSLITGIYGMNFAFMPELDFPWAYPSALLLMVVFAVVLFVIFRRRNWL